MTIRHKVNISNRINHFENMFPKYSSYLDGIIPATPLLNVLAQQGKLRDYSSINPKKLSLQMKSTRCKQNEIKNIDEKINFIIKKHESNQKFGEKVVLIEFQVSSNYHEKQASLFELSKQPYRLLSPSSQKKQPWKSQKIKQQCKRLRERSNKIFDQHQQRGMNQLQCASNQNQSHFNSKYDLQIRKINERIKKTQQKKKKLNIKFSPFNILAKNKDKQNNFSDSSMKKASMLTAHSKQENKIQQMMQHYQKCNISQFKTIKIQKTGTIVKNKLTACGNSHEFNIPEANPQNLSTKQIKSNPHFKDLIKAFCYQISLDQQLRNHKIWFTFSSEDAKWQKLEEIISERGFQMSSECCRSTFSSTVEQHNPFYQWRDVNFYNGLDELMNSYEKCQRNWKESIANKWGKKELPEMQLKLLIILDEHRMHFSTSDLARFINTESGKQFRKRDIHIFFKRLVCKCSSQLQFTTFFSALTHS